MPKDKPLTKMRIGIIGGSIAGCSAAILLERLGAKVTVLERASTSLQARGAGIVLPDAFVQRCIALDLFDPKIPFLHTKMRSFFTQDPKHSAEGRQIWQQEFKALAFNWQHVFKNLRKRIPNSCYHNNVEIRCLHEVEGGYLIEAVNGDRYNFDMIIAADGINSSIRKQIFPSLCPSYAGYVAWRGVTNISKILAEKLFNEHVPYYVFPKGHILSYRILASDSHSGTLLNWVMYENLKDISLEKFLVDKNGVRHEVSLPPGSLDKQKINHLHTFAKENLPAEIAEIICKTEAPFIQAVFDLQIPQYVKSKICFIGDSAAVLRPHSASGVIKSISDSISLAEILVNFNFNNLDTLLARWNSDQTVMATQQSLLAKNMGEALVTDTPDWQMMNHKLMEEWWQSVMQGKSWYATQEIKPTSEEPEGLVLRAKL